MAGLGILSYVISRESELNKGAKRKTHFTLKITVYNLKTFIKSQVFKY